MQEHEFLGGKKPLPGKRMTLAQCRKVAPELSDLTDEELLEIRDQLYEFEEIIYEMWRDKRRGSKSPAGVLTEPESGVNVK